MIKYPCEFHMIPLETNNFNHMKKIMTLAFSSFFTSLTGLCTVWTITNSGVTFSPATVTINQGDTVNFVLESEHNAIQVSQLTWNANGSVALSGGFQTSFGGGMVLPEQLTPGTHFYVCTPHASFGMKGTIVVQATTGIGNNELLPDFSIQPNPSNGKFKVETKALQSSKQPDLKVFNVRGEKIHQSVITSQETEIDLNDQSSGIYFVRLDDGQTVRTEKIVIQ